MLLTLYLSSQLLCAGVDKSNCVQAGVGTRVNPTPVGTYRLVEWEIDPAQQPISVYGEYWWELIPTGTTKPLKKGGYGIHAYYNFMPGRVSHGCVRVSKDSITWLKDINPTELHIVK